MIVYYFTLALLPLAILAGAVRGRYFPATIAVIMAVITIFVSGLRWSADIDQPDYIEMFSENPTVQNFGNESIAELHGEPGYLLLSAVFKSMGLHFVVLSMFCAAISIALKVWIIGRFTKAVALAFGLYLCVHFVTIEFIQIRWAVASAIITVAIYFQFKRRLLLAFGVLAIATSFHYFSLCFVLVGALVEIKSLRLFFAIVVSLSIAGLLVALDGFVVVNTLESELYIVRRTLRYLSESLSSIGFLSYARLAMIPFIFQIMVIRNPVLCEDPSTDFLRKVSYASIALTMLVSFVPIMHFRAVVLADIFSMALLCRVLDYNKRKAENIVILILLSCLYSIWYIIDISNYISAERLFTYKTWLSLLY